MKDNILILGKGYIGSRLQEGLGYHISEREIYSFQDIEEELRKFKPQTIINCIGNMGQDVGECEKEIDKTLMANSFVPIILAEAALRKNIRLIHISSACIFHYDYAYDSPIDENKTPDFFDLFYSRSKMYADQALFTLSSKYNILMARIRVPLDNRPHPRNLLTKLIKYKKAIDLPNSVTYIPDFIRALQHLIKIKARGIFNLVNRGALLYPDLLEVYKKYVPEFRYEVIDFSKLNLVRTNMILSCHKLEESGFKVRGVREVLQECVKEFIRY